MSKVAKFFWGFFLPFRAAGLILRHPILLFWSAIPVAISITLYYFGLRVAAQNFELGVKKLILTMGVPQYGWLAVGVHWMVLLVVFIVGVVTFTYVCSLVAVPFNDFLAEAAERFVSPSLPPAPHASIPRKLFLMWIDFLKTLATMAVALLALLISWVPVIGLLGFLVGALAVSFQYLSFPQTRRGERVLVSTHFLWQNLLASAGLGAALSILFLVPLVSYLIMPLAVVSGTMLYAQGKK